VLHLRERQRSLVAAAVSAQPRLGGGVIALTALLVAVGGASAGARSSVGASPAVIGEAAWSPSGKKIVYGRSVAGTSQLVAIDGDGQNPQVVWEQKRDRSSCEIRAPRNVSYSGDAQRLAFDDNFCLVVADAAGRTVQKWVGYWDYVWAPDGQALAAYTGDLGGALVILVPGRPSKRITHGRPVVDPAWSPNGKWVLFARDLATSGGMPDPGPYDLYRIDERGRGLKRLARGAERGLWSPRGDRIAFFRRRGWEIWGVAAGGSLRRQLRRLPGTMIEPARWSRDGKRLFLVRNGSRSARLVANGAQGLEFSPDGRRIVFASFSRKRCGGGVSVLTVASGTVRNVAGPCQ
jgi:Tol biopolymer transport system component